MRSLESARSMCDVRQLWKSSVVGAQRGGTDCGMTDACFLQAYLFHLFFKLENQLQFVYCYFENTCVSGNCNTHQIVIAVNRPNGQGSYLKICRQNVYKYNNFSAVVSWAKKIYVPFTSQVRHNIVIINLDEYVGREGNTFFTYDCILSFFSWVICFLRSRVFE